MNRQTRLNNRRRSVLLTRKNELKELKDQRFDQLATEISGKIEPILQKMVDDAVNRALEEHGLIK